MSLPHMIFSLPRRVTVRTIIQSRYFNNLRPESWDDRLDGIDTIETTDGERIALSSDGGQSPPQPGWVILLISSAEGGASIRWTLYGIPKHEQARSAALGE
jgi:hypothetical protein